MLQSFKPEKREASLRWLYSVLLRASAPSSTGSIPLQTAGSKAVAVWWSQGTELSLLQVALHGGWKYVWRYSGWDRRGRFPGYSEVISSVRGRLMANHENAFFYLLTYARRPELTEAEAKQQLAAVVLPVTKRVRSLREKGSITVYSHAKWAAWLSIWSPLLPLPLPLPIPSHLPASPHHCFCPCLDSLCTVQADERGQPCYVEVTNAADVPLFESFGFTARPGEITPLFGVKFTVMTRSPRS